jgi:hypothetical protein
MIKTINKRSLGGLRINHRKTQAKQPDYIGRHFLKRETIQQLYAELKSNPNELIECGLAGCGQPPLSGPGVMLVHGRSLL